MDKRKLLRIVEFCILMENNDGILGKAPSYILEKYEIADGSGILLDFGNHQKFQHWKQLWFKEDI